MAIKNNRDPRRAKDGERRLRPGVLLGQGGGSLQDTTEVAGRSKAWSRKHGWWGDWRLAGGASWAGLTDRGPERT